MQPAPPAHAAAHPLSPALPDPALLDAAMLAELAATLGPDATTQAIGLFVRDARARILALRAAAAAGDHAGAGMLAHALAGSAGAVGATAVAAAARRVLASPACPDAVAALERALAASAHALHGIVAGQGG